jgi:hypothetical protein
MVFSFFDHFLSLISHCKQANLRRLGVEINIDFELFEHLAFYFFGNKFAV